MPEKADSNPFAAMKALQRVDDLDGTLTPKDELKKPHEGTGEHQPIFSLPPGTNIQVNIRNVEFQKSKDIKTIDVTPETVD